MSEETTKDAEANYDTTKSNNVNSGNIVEGNTIFGTAVEFVTQTTTDKSHARNELFNRTNVMDRKIPEIGDPAVEEKLNRLTNIRRSNIRRRPRKPETLSRRITIERSRGTNTKVNSPENDDSEVRNNGEQEVAKVNSSSSMKSRIKRPPGFKHHLRANDNIKRKSSGILKSIKRMRIKNGDKKAVKVDSISNKKSEADSLIIKQQPRFRAPSGGRIQSFQTSPKIRRIGSPVKSLHNIPDRKGYSTTITTISDTATTTTTTTTTVSNTTEKIPISTNAQRISNELKDAVDITDKPPIVELDNISEISEISEVSNRIAQPVAQELISVIPIPDNMFSQATHQLMKAKKTSSEIFLPTLVPLLRKTPSKEEVPIIEPGTIQSE